VSTIELDTMPQDAVCRLNSELMFNPYWDKGTLIEVRTPGTPNVYNTARIMRVTCTAPGYRDSVRFVRSELGDNAASAQVAGATGLALFAIFGNPAGVGGVTHLATSYRFPQKLEIDLVPIIGATPAQIAAEREAVLDGIESWRTTHMSVCRAQTPSAADELSGLCLNDLERIAKTEENLLARIDSW
jgi:hypothetical protein